MNRQSTPIPVKYNKILDDTPKMKRRRLINDEGSPFAQKYQRTEAEMTAAVALLMLRYESEEEHNFLIPSITAIANSPRIFEDDNLNLSRISYDDSYESPLQRFKRTRDTYEEWSASSQTSDGQSSTITPSNTTIISMGGDKTITTERPHHYTRSYSRLDQKTKRLLKDRISNDDILRKLLDTTGGDKERNGEKDKKEQLKLQKHDESKNANNNEPSAIECCRNILNDFLADLKQKQAIWQS